MKTSEWFLHRATALALIWFAASEIAWSQESSVWKTGTAFRQQLDAAISLTWSERQLRDGLANLSKTTGVAIFLDRRIDPNQTIELTAAEEPVQLLLAKIGGQAKAQVTVVGSCVYLGPAQSADKLATLAAVRKNDVAPLPPEVKSRLLKTQAWQWSELAQPRRLLDDLAKQAGVSVQNPELIPHDLWPALSLPPLTWVDRMSLLLAGFGLTFEIGGQGTVIRLVPMPDSVVLDKTYSTRGDAADLAVQLKRIVPQARIRTEPGKLHVSAAQDDHDKIERLLAGQSVKTTKAVKPGAGGGEKRYTLTVENQPAGAVLKTLAGSLGKELKYDATLLDKLKRSTSFSVKDVTLDELMKKTLEPLGLAYKVDEKSLEVVMP